MRIKLALLTKIEKIIIGMIIKRKTNTAKNENHNNSNSININKK